MLVIALYVVLSIFAGVFLRVYFHANYKDCIMGGLFLGFTSLIVIVPIAGFLLFILT
jgi:hypothetical protein